MNCKPGDLAVFYTTLGYQELEPMLGMTFELDRLSLDETVKKGKPMWLYKGERRFMPKSIPYIGGLELLAIADTHLKPLRDSDGQDETLTWKTVPSSDKEKV